MYSTLYIMNYILFLLNEWNLHSPIPNSAQHTFCHLPPAIPWAGHTGMPPASKSLDTIRRSYFRRTAKTLLGLPKAFFLLGSRLRSPLIPLACHKYPCLLSQDLGWTWAGDPGGSQLQCPRSSCLLQAWPKASPETLSLLIFRNWADTGLSSTNIYQVPITRSMISQIHFSSVQLTKGFSGSFSSW